MFREPTDVLLGLFSAKSIVTFEDIPITKTARRTLHIHNPTDDVLKVKINGLQLLLFQLTSKLNMFLYFVLLIRVQVLVTKTLNPIANAQLEWTSNEIPARSFISMDIVWNPVIAWSTREIIQFTDNRNFKKDVAVILKSIDKTKTSKANLKKSIGIKSYAAENRVMTRKLALKSPSPRQKLQQRNRLNLAIVNGTNKKDVPMSAKVQPKKVLGTNNQVNFMQSLSSLSPVHHEKENMEPKSPPNMSNVFDSLNFTPTTKCKPDTTSVDYLASLPTPNTNLEKNQSFSVRNHVMSTPLEMRSLDETQTLIKTPMIKINDTTTTLNGFATPMDRSEVDNSHYFNDINDRNLFAMQKTPGISTSEIFAVPSRKLNLDIPNVSPNGRTASENRDNDISFGINRTQTLSSPIGLPKLSIIEEEHHSKIEMSETYIKQNDHHLTYNVVPTPPNQESSPAQPTENLVRDVELISTPLSKKYLSMKELTDNNTNLSLEQKILKMNQGSMPNLHKLDKVKSIENNRYFYQSVEKDLQEAEQTRNNDEENENLGDISVCSVKSTVSTQSVAFNEHEIQAQSSRLNLNEIGRPKTAPKPMNNFCFTVDFANKAPSSANRMSSNKYLSTSSPSVNKSIREKSKFSQSVRDISVSAKSLAKSRPSVIAYANRSVSGSSLSLKKRGRDDNLDTSKKSLNKMSPPKRVCIEPESPKATRGQSFRTTTWGNVMPKKFRIPSIPPHRLQLRRPEEERVILYDPEVHMRSKQNNKYKTHTQFDLAQE